MLMQRNYLYLKKEIYTNTFERKNEHAKCLMNSTERHSLFCDKNELYIYSDLAHGAKHIHAARRSCTLKSQLN